MQTWRDVAAMHRWLHPNICKIHGVAVEPATGDLALVMAFCDCGSIKELLTNKTVDLDCGLILAILGDIAAGAPSSPCRARVKVVGCRCAMVGEALQDICVGYCRALTLNVVRPCRYVSVAFLCVVPDGRGTIHRPNMDPKAETNVLGAAQECTRCTSRTPRSPAGGFAVTPCCSMAPTASSSRT